MTSIGLSARATGPSAFDSRRCVSVDDEVQRATDALWAIDAGCERERWLRVIMGAVAAGIAEDEIIRWSEGGANFAGAADVRSVVRSIRPDGGVGVGTLFALASQEGWRSQSFRPRASSLIGSRTAAEALSEASRASTATSDVEALWRRFEPASSAHPYVTAKCGRPDGLRVVPVADPLRVAGLSMVGALAVPVLSLESGEVLSLQFIAGGEQAVEWKAAGKPSKLNLPGHQVTGAFIVGSIASGQRAFLCEGLGTAWAVSRATGAPAVVAFGWGRVRVVAAEMRRVHPSIRLVICPDVGKEADAAAISGDLGVEWVEMPRGKPANYDAGDFAAEHGDESLAALLHAVHQTERATHPLARFIDLQTEPKPPRWVLPHFIAEEMLVISGPPGIGKTSCLLPLLLTAAGLHREGDPLAPPDARWRHCVFVTEDVLQAQRILVGAVEHGHRRIRWEEVRERIHIVKSHRMSPTEVAEVAPEWRRFVRVVEGVELPPIVVLDTRSAVLAVAEENDNAEASEAVAVLREAFPSWPLWVIAHTSKSDAARHDIAMLSPRGAGAWVGDGAGTAFILPGGEDNVRRFVLGKTRNAPRWRELRAVLESVEVEARNAWGESELTRLEWGEASPVSVESAKTRSEVEEARKASEAAALLDEIRAVVSAAWEDGLPLARSAVAAKVRRQRAAVLKGLDALISQHWICVVSVPRELRTNTNRSEFLVSLTPDERGEFHRSGVLPMRLSVIPASWRKPGASDVVVKRK